MDGCSRLRYHGLWAEGIVETTLPLAVVFFLGISSPIPCPGAPIFPILDIIF